MRADLHLHTNASDGAANPADLAHRAALEGIRVIAVTDHDTTAGSRAALAADVPNVTVIPGVELSLRDMRQLHLLGYGACTAPALEKKLTALAAGRSERAEHIMDLLEKHGMPLDRAAVRASARGSIGRPHIADALVRAGFVASRDEAFDRWLADGAPCYASAPARMSMREALALLTQCGWVPVLAHPCLLGRQDHELAALVHEWAREGLAGLEVWHPSAARRGTAALVRLARDEGLLVTGGSDDHGSGDGTGALGCMTAQWETAERDVGALRLEIERRMKKVRGNICE